MKLKNAWILLCFVTFGCGDLILSMKEKELLVIDVPSRNYKLKVVYYPSNATIESSIQVHRAEKMGKPDQLIANYDSYNFVDTTFFLNDSLFVLILRDTIWGYREKADTLKLAL